MTNERNWLTCKEAGALLNFTQRHVLNLIKKGKISAEKDEDGKFYIQKSEFFRVYPHLMQVEIDRNSENSVEQGVNKVLEERIRHLQEMVDEKKKQNEFLTEQLSNFTQEKSKMLDAINSHTRLLEFKETSGKSHSTTVHQSDRKRLQWWPFTKS